MTWRAWTQSECDYLSDKWGTVSLKSIAKNLNRSENAILIKVQRLGLSAFLESGEYISFNQLLKALGVNGGYGYKPISWIRNRHCPVKTKRVNNSTFRVIYLQDFWKWAEQNKSFLDFSTFEENSLGEEPEWAKVKRRNDIEAKRRYIKTPWTKTEDEKLKRLVGLHKHTYSVISKMMRRTEGAIQRRCCELNLTGRPLRESPHSKWNQWQLEQIPKLIDSGCTYEMMSAVIGKSTKAIRGKVYVMYGTENLDKARIIMSEMENGHDKKRVC